MDSVHAPEFDPHISAYYTDAFDEVDRLAVSALGRLEFGRTKELLLRFLPPAPASVLDVGGGPGVYAAWLASLGHEVTLVDRVPRHCEQAAEHGTFAVEVGDARALSQADASAILADFAAAGLGEPRVHGIEGPLHSLMASGLADGKPEYLEAAMRAARLADDHPAPAAGSGHLLATTCADG